ncbi:uncharacterized protein LOC114762539 [Neltuma alba]|uniref:uncharacterized protein LOC114762539 n=1 Tax=Neltuma alba TaxID=207710 RepID=UPI0010A431F7|nr:uncharacterized protein LOC114762539 [Prosopis alba]
MKKSGLVAAYMAAASATAVSVSSPSSSSSLKTLHQDAPVQRNQENSSSASSSSADKFAPRFDGLRFIETLVTAHR